MQVLGRCVWNMTKRGNCLTAKNTPGAVDTYHYDVLNRMLEAKFADDNEIRLTYKTIMRNPIYFHHDLSMVFQKVFVIKGNIPDNDKSVCDNAEFVGIIFLRII